MTVIKNAEALAQHIRQQIASGQLKPGDKLPSLAEMTEGQAISKGTAQRGIDKLKAEGLIESRHGAGNYVRDTSERIVRQAPGDIFMSVSLPGQPRTVRRIDEVPAPWVVARNLGVEEGDPVLLRRTTVDHEGHTVQLENAYFPVELTRGTPVAYHDPGEGGIYARLAEKGEVVAVFHERLKARAASPEEVAVLDLKAGPTVLEIVRLSRTEDRVIEVAQLVLDASVYEVWFDVPARSTDTP
ncbi:GntR family transcriptional regulator [Paractinoplanes ferrugineus]|uniref:Transcriptional regulator n=1 Tax=Paractinoplanes ferrugineus TaxID=113564 RepID=A0A919J985_9ACTN|nr:GntR family transcriptional regulator [Actinoplanes ferrugineus]GIE16870.1 transcriptional regulator [Actinoplanes ferrugineus]